MSFALFVVHDVPPQVILHAQFSCNFKCADHNPKVVSKVLAENLNNGVREMYLVGRLDSLPMNPDGYGGGTQPPIDDEWTSPFLGKSAEECAAALATAIRGSREALVRWKFLVMDHRIKEGELVACYKWTEKEEADAIAEVYGDIPDEDDATDEDKELIEQEREPMLAQIPSAGIKQIPLPQQDAVKYMINRSTDQWQADLRGDDSLLGGYSRDQEWYTRVIEEWQARRATLPVR